MRDVWEKPPWWAIDILNEAWDKYGEGNLLPVLKWRWRDRGTRGTTWPSSVRAKITLTAGSKEERWRWEYVLCHEIAHALVGPGHHHDREFWVMAWTLYRHFKLPLLKIRTEEKAYKSRSVNGYRATRPSRAKVGA